MRELRYETLNDDRSLTSLTVLPLLLLDQNMPRRIESRNGSPKDACDILLGIVVSLGLSVAKISCWNGGALFALLADGLESGADVLSGHVVFSGLKITVKPRDAWPPLRARKAEPIAALCVGLSLVAAAVTIMVESIHEILTPHRLPAPTPAPYTLVVLAGVLIVKGPLFRHLGGVDSIGSLAANSDSWHHRSDAITSAFAFVGISITCWEGRMGNGR
jgi:cation diffusion facilitator family transporter